MKPPGTAAILLSRQALRPSGKSLWVRHSAKAIRWLKQNDFALCSSVGQQTWELLTAVASIEDVRLVLFLRNEFSSRFSRLCAEVTSQFDLKPEKTEFVPVDDAGGDRKSDTWMLRRDMALLSRADLILPVSIRKGGHMNRFCADGGPDGPEVDTRFETSYEKRSDPLAYQIDPSAVTHELRELTDRFLIHWTRSSNTAWPDERLIDYYRDIIKSDQYPRSGFDSLRRIVVSGHIIPSSRHMPGRVATVSFSGLSPMEVIPLMRWRSRYRQMSFEPYGIGILRGAAREIGLRPVRYVQARSHSSEESLVGWLEQSVGEKGDWRAEKEYRCLGGVDLSLLDRKSLIAFCRTRAEATLLQEQTGVRTLAFLEGLVD